MTRILATSWLPLYIVWSFRRSRTTSSRISIEAWKIVRVVIRIWNSLETWLNHLHTSGSHTIPHPDHIISHIRIKYYHLSESRNITHPDQIISHVFKHPGSHSIILSHITAHNSSQQLTLNRTYDKLRQPTSVFDTNIEGKGGRYLVENNNSNYI